MKYPSFAFAAACLLLLSACDNSSTSAPSSEAKEEPKTQGVAINAEQAAQIGLQTQNLAAAQYVPRVTGYGMVESLDTVAQLQADLAMASAAATESRATLARAQSLSRGSPAAIARSEVDAAVRTAASDEASLGLAQRKAIATFGKGAPWLNGHGEILAQLTSGKLLLVHASFTIGALPSGLPPYLEMTPLNRNESQQPVRSLQIWDAPADAAIPGRSFFALVPGSTFAEGQRLTVSAPAGTPQTGVLIPADAVLLSDNTAWYYSKASDGSYVRRPLDLSAPLPGGYFAHDNIKPGNAVVTAGAGLLLARELNPSTEVEE